MLADEIREFRTGMVYPGGVSHDAAVAGFKERVAAAQAFVMDREAIALAASVSLSKPSSLRSAIPLVRLPFPSTWIEFANADLRSAMADLGSPNTRHPATAVRILRSGFLMSQDDDGEITLEYVHADKLDTGEVVTDLAPVLGTFSTAVVDMDDLGPGAFQVPKSEGRVRRRLEMIASDPDEMAADEEIRLRFDWRPHPEMAPVRRALVAMMGEGRVAGIEAEQADEMYRLFMLQILPALILLACRNAVRVEPVEAPSKLNRARRKKGRIALMDHRVIRMHLEPKAAGAGGGIARGSGREARGTMVMGHFKVRKSGIYWWSPHARHGRTGGEIRRTFVLTR